MAKALKGVVVLELTQVLAGPFAVTMLADFGADVIQIEPPGGGFYHNRSRSGLSVAENRRMSWSKNRNRRSITLNLRNPKGKEIFLELVKKADIVVQNFSPGALARRDPTGTGWLMTQTYKQPQV
jgi:CoA:oxalate CoA-transferase